MRISQEPLTILEENEVFIWGALEYTVVQGPASSWDADLVKIIKIIKLSSMDGLHAKYSAGSPD